MSGYSVTIAGPQPAADWTAQNPVLSQFEIGQESDTGRIKIGDGVTAWNSLAYVNGRAKVYRAKIAQASTGAPTATILENTLGVVPAWARTSAGLYTLISTGAFPAGKVIVLFGAGKTGTPTTGGQIVAWAHTDADTLTLYGFDVAGAAADWLTSSLSIEILVYP